MKKKRLQRWQGRNQGRDDHVGVFATIGAMIKPPKIKRKREVWRERSSLQMRVKDWMGPGGVDGLCTSIIVASKDWRSGGFENKLIRLGKWGGISSVAGYKTRGDGSQGRRPRGAKGRRIVRQTLDEGVSMSKSTPDKNEHIQFLRRSALWPHVDVMDDRTLYSRFRRISGCKIQEHEPKPQASVMRLDGALTREYSRSICRRMRGFTR